MYDRIFRLDILWRAWKEVRANKGSAGIDGITFEMIEEYGVEEYLLDIQEDLRNRKYKPQSVKRVYTPKSDGKQRTLGVPTIRDRIVQQACKIVIEPIIAFEHLKRIMTRLKLTLNPQKTKIVDMNKESFDFLGFHYQKFNKTKSGRKLPYMMPSKKAMRKVKVAIRLITCRKSAYEGLEQKVEKLNPVIRGWRNYFQHGNSVKRFKQLDYYVWMKLWRRAYYRRKQKKYKDHVGNESYCLPYPAWWGSKTTKDKIFRK